MVVSAHANSMRALVKYLDGISDDDIVGLNIPNGIPLVYELDRQLAPQGHRYLGDAGAVAAAAAAVAKQGRRCRARAGSRARGHKDHKSHKKTNTNALECEIHI